MSKSYRGGDATIQHENVWTDGSNLPGIPAWTTWSRTIDVSTTAGRSLIAVPTRESIYNINAVGLVDLSVTVSYGLRHLADAVWDALITAMTGGTMKLVAVMSTTIATSGAKGWRIPALISQGDESQPLTDRSSGNLTLAPGDARDASGVLIPPSRLVTA